MVKTVALKCPSCNANLTVEEGRKFLYCQYCGAKITLCNDNEKINRNIDEAAVKRAETERMVQMRKMDMEEKRRRDHRNGIIIKLVISLVLGVIGGFLMLVGIFLGTLSGDGDSSFFLIAMVGFFPISVIPFIWIIGGIFNDRKEVDYQGRIKTPTSINDFQNKNYRVIESNLQNAGFKNIRCVAMNDLTLGLLKKPGMVESITVSGEEIYSGGDRYLPEAPIVISYHSFPTGSA